MNILLINDNPLVSRLLALCVGDRQMRLEEVTNLDTIAHKNYDIIFVDEGLYEADILSHFDHLDIGKKVLLSNTDFKKKDFDLIMKKPFLPSQIIEILENMLMIDDKCGNENKRKVSIFPLTTENGVSKEEKSSLKAQVLDVDELEKIKMLLEMNEEIEEIEEKLSEEERESRKVEAIKAQLIAEGLEIVEEDEMVDVLNTKNSDRLSKKSKQTKSSKKRAKKEKRRAKKSMDFTEEELECIEEAVWFTMSTLKRKKMKKLLKGKEINVSIKLEDND